MNEKALRELLLAAAVSLSILLAGVVGNVVSVQAAGDAGTVQAAQQVK